MTEQWINGCVVQRIMFRDGLVLSLNDYNELVISVPFHLRLPKLPTGDEEVVVVDPKAMKNEVRPLFDFAGQTITHADWDEDGSLHLGFSDGHEIHAHSNEHRTAWEMYGKYHGYAACLPHGEGRSARPRRGRRLAICPQHGIQGGRNARFGDGSDEGAGR